MIEGLNKEYEQEASWQHYQNENRLCKSRKLHVVHVLLLKNPHQFEINLPNKVSTFYLVPIFENVFWELHICSVYWGCISFIFKSGSASRFRKL